MIILTALLALAPAAPASADQPILLQRAFKVGEKSSYRVESKLNIEQRNYQYETYFPSTQKISYDFTTEVKALKNDGICSMRYQRPTMHLVIGEMGDRPEQVLNIKADADLLLDVSPINEVLTVKDLKEDSKDKKKPGAKKKKASWTGPVLNSISTNAVARQAEIIDSIAGNLYQMAAFTGWLGNGMDFKPVLPVYPVKVGDVWKKTESYAPKKLRGEKKSVNQRVDYVYTYKGIVDSNGKKVHRVTAELSVDGDQLDVIKSQYSNPEELPMSKIPLHLKINIEFDLDLDTRKTLAIRSEAVGDAAFWVKELPGQAYQDSKFKGKNSVKLMSGS